MATVRGDVIAKEMRIGREGEAKFSPRYFISCYDSCSFSQLVKQDDGIFFEYVNASFVPVVGIFSQRYTED